MADAYARASIPGTPTVEANNTRIDVIGPDGEAISVADFTAGLDAALQ
ncbi:hypothetical protein ABIA32_006236 [Streptacidiphilus sp. MAP12-20]